MPLPPHVLPRSPPPAQAEQGKTAQPPPPAVDGAALARCLACCVRVRHKHVLSPAWAEPLVQHGIVPAAAALLQRLLRAHRQGPGGLRMSIAMLAAAFGAAPAPVDCSEADQPCLALVPVEAVAAVVEDVSEVLVLAAEASHPAAAELWGQLAAPATLQALADAVRWVEAEAWPAERAAAAAAVAESGGQAQQAQQQLPAARMGAAAAPAAVHADLVRRGMAHGVLSSVAVVVDRTTSSVHLSLAEAAGASATNGGAAGAAAAAAKVTRQQALLAALKGSGVLSALSAALLAAPPCPEAMPNATEQPDASSLATAELHVFRALGALTTSIASVAGFSGATELLASPDVQRLRWAALEQLCGTGAADDVGGGRRMDGGGGGGGGACGGAGVPLLQLLQPHVVRGLEGMGGCLLWPYAVILAAALDAPARWLYGCQANATPPEKAERLAAAKKLLPPLRRLPPLAASCARAACAEVEAALRGLTAAASTTAGPGGSAGAGDSIGATSAELRGWCVSVAEQLANLALIVESTSADGSLPDLVETFGWALRAKAAVMAIEGGGAAPGACSVATMLAEKLIAPDLRVRPLPCRLTLDPPGPQDWSSFSPAVQAACVQRLRPTGLMQSFDSILRHTLTVAGLQAEGHRATTVSCTYLLAQTPPRIFLSHLEGAPGGRGGDGDGDGGSGGWRPQDELGLLVSLAKLARRQAEVQEGDATPPHSTSDVFMSPTNGISLATAVRWLVPLLAELVQASRVQHERDSGGAAATRLAGAAAAVREAVALASVTALPILGRVIARSLGSSSIAADCYVCISIATHCLAAAVQLLPTADLLALQPQRTLAQLGAMLQQALGFRRPGAGQGTQQQLAAVFHEVAGEVAEVLLHMAGDEQLVGVVAGWLRGEAAEAVPQHGSAGRQPQAQSQSLCGGLDAHALAAALRHWNAAAADEVARLYAAAAAGSAAATGAESEGGGSRRRSSSLSRTATTAAASADGAVEPLSAAARAAIAQRPATLLWGLQDGGVGGLPSWPPRCLRLCGNPGCRSFAGASEAALPLLKCAGCKAVRYCGAGCQQQHWKEGGHKAVCAQLRAATEAARGGD
ncbi:hypothetical protein TSOC_005224 [Tetrabaena socialis]|uniref:phytol kinase n=1 Tax=Tetrabaena socialis TaxID=47790 RepID=A0A2J8A6U6_9CHLO|nr:hypothetical protein TSOC_005224 [Tetrabaena socialis]|eukprot:PNH08213.1 hypothetical protein TSOC_005224 [Tetrabaena socialis]